jgi:hypothetical protein
VLRSKDRGFGWEVIGVVIEGHGDATSYDEDSLASNLDWENIQECGEGFEVYHAEKMYKCRDELLDEHIVVFVARNTHATYIRKDACENQGCDHCGEGAALLAPLPADPALAMTYNVGEPRIVLTEDENRENAAHDWNCGGLPGSFGRHAIPDEDLGHLGFEELYREYIWSKAYEPMVRANFCGGMSSQGLACAAEGTPEACSSPFPYDRNGYSPNCEAAFIEEKLSFAPYCPCQE